MKKKRLINSRKPSSKIVPILIIVGLSLLSIFLFAVLSGKNISLGKKAAPEMISRKLIPIPTYSNKKPPSTANSVKTADIKMEVVGGKMLYEINSIGYGKLQEIFTRRNSNGNNVTNKWITESTRGGNGEVPVKAFSFYRNFDSMLSLLIDYASLDLAPSDPLSDYNGLKVEYNKGVLTVVNNSNKTILLSKRDIDYHAGEEHGFATVAPGETYSKSLLGTYQWIDIYKTQGNRKILFHIFAHLGKDYPYLLNVEDKGNGNFVVHGENLTWPKPIENSNFPGIRRSERLFFHFVDLGDYFMLHPENWTDRPDDYSETDNCIIVEDNRICARITEWKDNEIKFFVDDPNFSFNNHSVRVHAEDYLLGRIYSNWLSTENDPDF